jgi:hypothetical protein
VIDWGSASRGDPAFDFAGVPLRAVPFMLEGYRRVSALDGYAPVEARILWRHLHLSLYVLGRGPLPGWSWAERPLPTLLDVLRFFVDALGGAWAALKPRCARYFIIRSRAHEGASSSDWSHRRRHGVRRTRDTRRSIGTGRATVGRSRTGRPRVTEGRRRIE